MTTTEGDSATERDPNEGGEQSVRPDGDPSLRRRVYERTVPGSVRRNYAAKFVLTLLLVVVVVGVIGIGTYVQIQGTIRDEATTSLEITSEVQSAAVGDWTEELRTQTRMVANPQSLPDAADTAALNSYLQSARDRGSGSILGIHYVDTEAGTVVASTTDAYRGQSLSAVGEPWSGADSAIVERASDGVAVSERSYDLGGGDALAFVTATRGGDRIVVTARPGSALTQMGSGHEDVSAHLLTSDGNSVLSTDGGDGLADAPAFEAAVGGRTATVETGSVVRTYTPVAGTDWIAVATAEQSTLYAVSDTVGRNVIALIAAGLVSVLIVGITLGRSTVSPLVELRERTKTIEEGDLDVDLSTRRTDEIGRLYAAFDSMRAALADQFRQAERAKREAERSRQEMERQNRRLDQFASTLSHDLRNPLAVARGHVELLDTKLDAGDDDLREHVEKIDVAHDRIDSIINDVLTLTRKGESIEETERFDLEGVAREAWSHIDSKDASLTVAESIAIEGERSRLLRAFENLFRNSLDHGPADVSVTVGLTDDGFYIQDDGPGIPDEEMGDIFEYGHTTSDDGTGLGLSIVKTIAEAHGWSLWVDGTYGAGARFVFADVFATEERIFEETAFTWDHAAGDDD
jgi:signal transduction histidine kinase